MFSSEKNGSCLPLKDYRITARVDNSIATIELTQTYINELESPIETTYMFPSDANIVMSKLVIQVGERVIEGKVMEKEEAKQKYDDGVASGKAAVLVEETKKELIKMTVGNILPKQ